METSVSRTLRREGDGSRYPTWNICAMLIDGLNGEARRRALYSTFTTPGDDLLGRDADDRGHTLDEPELPIRALRTVSRSPQRLPVR
jgi:hypothetical protein